MSSVILQADSLNLPESYATMLKGKKVELIKNDDDSIVIKPIDLDTVISEMRGVLKGSNFGTAKFLDQKRRDKELEDGR